MRLAAQNADKGFSHYVPKFKADQNNNDIYVVRRPRGGWLHRSPGFRQACVPVALSDPLRLIRMLLQACGSRKSGRESMVGQSSSNRVDIAAYWQVRSPVDHQQRRRKMRLVKP
jgi:hypothetical protein